MLWFRDFRSGPPTGVRPHPTSLRSLVDSPLIPAMRWTLREGKGPPVAWYVLSQVSLSIDGGGPVWRGCGRLRIPTWWWLLTAPSIINAAAIANTMITFSRTQVCFSAQFLLNSLELHQIYYRLNDSTFNLQSYILANVRLRGP